MDYQDLSKEDLIKELLKRDGQILKLQSNMAVMPDRKMIEQLELKVLENNKLLQESRRYNRVKSQIFSSISHELKTPLNIIFGCVQLLEKLHVGIPFCTIYPSITKYTKIMRQNCYRLLRLINNFIDINKIEVGFFKLNPRNRDIVKIIEDITLSIVDYTNSKDIELVFDTDVEEKILACDAEKLERVVLNLLSNAIKFTEPGGKIEVSIQDYKNSILVSVKDTGTGIPEDMLEKIFEPFNQVDGSLRKKSDGNGIGLSLVKALIELHGGNISVSSKLGEGSEFVFEIPIKLVEGAEHPSHESPSEGDSKIERISVEFSDIYS